MKTIPELAKRWLGRQPDAISEQESRILASAIEGRAIARDIAREAERRSSLGDRLADSIARVGGSWSFILAFLAFLLVWTLGNVWLAGRGAFDPYPFIFLNLVLSMLAALQAPVIMMSQNRAAEHDRIDASHDYEVNLKAEIEIMALHEKLDEMRHKEVMALIAKVDRLAETLVALESRIARREPD
jgi:uncharacterized membrane protein